MDDLVVDDELTATVVDDEGANGATAVREGLGDALVQAALGDDLEALLDITGLGHGNETVVITDVQDAVGLEDGAGMVWTTTEGEGLATKLDSSCNLRVKRSTPR